MSKKNKSFYKPKYFNYKKDLKTPHNYIDVNNSIKQSMGRIKGEKIIHRERFDEILDFLDDNGILYTLPNITNKSRPMSFNMISVYISLDGTKNNVIRVADHNMTKMTKKYYSEEDRTCIDYSVVEDDADFIIQNIKCDLYDWKDKWKV